MISRAADRRSRWRRSVTGWELDDDARRRSAEMKNRIGEFSTRSQHGAIRVGKVHDELAFQVNAFAGCSAIGDFFEIARRNETAEWHFPRRKSFPTPATGGRRQCAHVRSGRLHRLGAHWGSNRLSERDLRC
jgi:hypothetical protein